MFKFLGLLFLASLVSLPVANIATVDSFDEPSNRINENVLREGEEDSDVLHGYTYTDNFESSPIRTFDSHALGPTLNANFCAPMGYVYSSTISDEQIQEIVDQIMFIHGDLTWLNISFFYGIYGTEVYADSNSKWYVDEEDLDKEIAWFKEVIATETRNHEILKIEEVTSPAELFLRMDIKFTVPGEDGPTHWTFSFYGESVAVEPYGEHDFVNPRINYYQRLTHEKRINLFCDLIPGFFNEYDIEGHAYNPYGWLTDTTTEYPYAPEPRPDGTPHYFCDYNITLIAFDTVPIGVFDQTKSIEMTYPTSPIRAKLKLDFTAGGVNHVFYSNDFILGDPNVKMSVDGPQDRKSVQKDTEHLYSIEFENIDLTKLCSLALDAEGMIDRLIDDGEHVIYCYDAYGVDQLPERGKEGVYYYIPSENEKALHSEGKDAEFIDKPSEGEYFIWTSYYDYEDNLVEEYRNTASVNFMHIEHYQGQYNEETGIYFPDEPISPELLDDLLNEIISFPFTGRFTSFMIRVEAQFLGNGYANIVNEQPELFEIVPHIDTTDEIIIDYPNSINMLSGGDDIVITPKVSSYDESINYYFNYHLSREGIIEVSQDLDGKTTIRPLKAGVVDLTFEADSSEFSTIKKTVSIRVLDGIFDNATIHVKDEFHKAGVNVDASIAVRGFTGIVNANIVWKVVNKKGEEVAKENIVSKDGASMTLINPDSDDYTITAYYEDIEIANLTIQVRYVDMDKFLRMNIWWIVVITLGFVALVVFLTMVTKRGKSTVDRIERVYQVYCQCISNDSLSKQELVRIKREITRCLHHCEDLNIDAFNQYEKATRYLRKSLGDTKILMKDYDTLTEGDKSVMYDRLNADLGKALNVAKEIESAKQLVEQHHFEANRKNYETIEVEKKKGKKDK